jgi:hypothetical protein
LNAGLELIGTNIGISVPNIIIIVVAIAGIIFYARDLKTGIIMHNFAFFLLTLLFYYFNAIKGNADWDYTKPLYIFFILFIIMAFMLYQTKQDSGGISG